MNLWYKNDARRRLAGWEILEADWRCTGFVQVGYCSTWTQPEHHSYSMQYAVCNMQHTLKTIHSSLSRLKAYFQCGRKRNASCPGNINTNLEIYLKSREIQFWHPSQPFCSYSVSMAVHHLRISVRQCISQAEIYIAERYTKHTVRLTTVVLLIGSHNKVVVRTTWEYPVSQ